jgi:glycosyltransferase involved in cell wall biosynthesis
MAASNADRTGRTEIKEKTERESFGQAEQLKKALDCLPLREMLNGRQGAFTSRYWFINEYLNRLNLLGSDPSLAITANSQKKDHSRISLKEACDLAKKGAQFLHMILKDKKIIPADILIISRPRTVKIKTKTGYLEGDYVFYSVIDELNGKHPDLTTDIFLIDDSILKYKYATVWDLLRSVLLALEKSSRWRLKGKRVSNCLREGGCGNAARFSEEYFRIRPLIRNALLGYSLKNLFQAKKPQAIVSNDDCMYTRPLLDNYSNPKFIVLQSARMQEYAEACRSLIFQEPGMLSDYFLASGKIFGEIKERWHIADQVIVTGLPRYDILSRAHEVYSKKEFLKRYDLNAGDRIIHWSTQCHVLSKEENALNIKAIFGAINSLAGVSLVIKQHPAEPERYTRELMEQIERYGINAVITPKDSDTYEQLFVCDLTITRHSTTAMEAIALGKPVIILNLSGNPDPVEYVQEGVARGIYDSDDLQAAIEQLLTDDRDLSAKRGLYIEKYLNKIDGKATERVIKIIMESIKKL